MPQKKHKDTVIMSVRLDRRVHGRLRKLAEEQRRPASEIVTAAVLAAMTACPTCGRAHDGVKGAA